MGLFWPFAVRRPPMERKVPTMSDAKAETKEKIRCGICDREMDPSDNPKWGIGGFACTEEAAKAIGKALGIEISGPISGPSFFEICPECHKKEMGTEQ
jgi:hypothetical protein